MGATYLDASAIVKLVVREPGTDELRRFLRRRKPVTSSALSRTEVLRSLLPSGEAAIARGRDALSRLDLVRINQRILDAAGVLLPHNLRSLDAIHLATALELGKDLGWFVTYDERMAEAAAFLSVKVASPLE